MAPKGLESVDSTTYNWVPSHTATALWPVRPPVPNLGTRVFGREAKARRRGGGRHEPHTSYAQVTKKPQVSMSSNVC